jgi:hypothetical protein
MNDDQINKKVRILIYIFISSLNLTIKINKFMITWHFHEIISINFIT